MPRIIDNFDLTGAFSYLVEDVNEGGLGLTRVQAQDQIARRLSQEAGFDIEAAQKAGFSNDEILSKLTGIPQRGALRTIGKGIVEELPEAAAGAAGAWGAIAAGSRLLTKIPTKPTRALGYVGTGLAGAIAGTAAEEAIPLEELTIGRLTPEDRVLPSDMPFYKAGAGLALFGTYSGVLRSTLKKLPPRLVEEGKTGIDLGAARLVENVGRLRDTGGRRYPLSWYGAKVLGGLEKGFETLGARARGDLPGYGRIESIVAGGAGIGGGIAEYIDPGDPKSQFLGHILGAGIAPIGPIVGGVTKTAQFAQRLIKGPAETAEGVSQAALERFKPWQKARARKEVDRIFKVFNDHMEATAREQGVDYVPINYQTIQDLFTAYPKALKEAGFAAENIPTLEKLATTGMVGPIEKTMPLTFIHNFMLRNNPAAKTAFEARSKEIARIYKDDFNGLLEKAGEVDPEFLNTASALNRVEFEDLLVTDLEARYKNILPVIDKALVVEKITQDDAAIKIAQAMVEGYSGGRRIRNYLYNKVDPSLTLSVMNFVTGWDLAKAPIGAINKGGPGAIQQIINILPQHERDMLAQAGIEYPLPMDNMEALRRKFTPRIDNLKIELPKRFKEAEYKPAEMDLDALMAETKRARLRDIGESNYAAMVQEKGKGTIPTVKSETGKRKGDLWTGSKNLFVPGVRGELKLLSQDPTTLATLGVKIGTPAEVSTAIDIALKGGHLAKNRARIVEALVTNEDVLRAALEKMEIDVPKEVKEARAAVGSLNAMLPWSEGALRWTGTGIYVDEASQLVTDLTKALKKAGLDITPRQAISIFDKAEVASGELILSGRPSVPEDLSIGQVRAIRRNLKFIARDEKVEGGVQTVANELVAKLDEDLNLAGRANKDLRLANDFNEALEDVYTRSASGKRLTRLQRKDDVEKLIRNTLKGGEASDRANAVVGISREMNFIQKQVEGGTLAEVSLGKPFPPGPEPTLGQIIEAELALERERGTSFAAVVDKVYRGAMEEGVFSFITHKKKTGLPYTVRDVPKIEKPFEAMAGTTGKSEIVEALLDERLPLINYDKLAEYRNFLADVAQKTDDAPEVSRVFNEILNDLGPLTAEGALSAVYNPTSQHTLNAAKQVTLNKLTGSENAQVDIETILASKNPSEGLKAITDAINRTKKSEVLTYSANAGGLVAGKKVYPELVSAYYNAIIESVLNKTEALKPFAERSDDWKPKEGREYYSPAQAAYDSFFNTGKAKDGAGNNLWPNWGETPLIEQLLDSGMTTKAHSKQINDFFATKTVGWIDTDRALYTDQAIVQLAEAMYKDPGEVTKAATAMMGARLGSIFQQWVGRMGMAGSGTIQVPGIMQKFVSNELLQTPRLVYLDLVQELLAPGKQDDLFKFLNEAPESAEGRRFLGRLFMVLTGATLAPLTATAGYFTGEDPLDRPRYYPTRETLGLAERGSLAPEPPAQTEPPPPMAQAQPPPAPAPMAQMQPSPASPAMRSQYAAAFPFDPASDVIRQQQARAPAQQGIGSLV